MSVWLSLMAGASLKTKKVNYFLFLNKTTFVYRWRPPYLSSTSVICGLFCMHVFKIMSSLSLICYCFDGFIVLRQSYCCHLWFLILVSTEKHENLINVGDRLNCHDLQILKSYIYLWFHYKALSCQNTCENLPFQLFYYLWRFLR